MKIIGLLMIEHRLIERMLALVEKELKRIQEKNTVDIKFIGNAIDFFKTYADRCHHGKEENILFMELAKKNLSEEHQKIMKHLTEEHVIGRGLIKKLNDAYHLYTDKGSLQIQEIQKTLETLLKLYPQHIKTEDCNFFLPAMEYFTAEESASLLQRGLAFDQKMIHEKYKSIIAEAEKTSI